MLARPRLILAVPSLCSCLAYENLILILIGIHLLSANMTLYSDSIHSLDIVHAFSGKYLFLIGNYLTLAALQAYAVIYSAKSVTSLNVARRSDPIGGSKAFFWNAELIFPITQDFNIKGACLLRRWYRLG